MESLIIEIVNLIPELGLALVVIWFVLKRDDLWRTALDTTTAEYKSLTEKTSAEYRASAEKIADEYKFLATQMAQEYRDLAMSVAGEYREMSDRQEVEHRETNERLERVILAATDVMARVAAISEIRQELKDIKKELRETQTAGE